MCTPAPTSPGTGSTHRGGPWLALACLALLAGCSGAADPPQGAATAPLIVSNPADQTVTAGQTATFSVVASGAAPLAYQWRRGGVAISGATATSYTTAATVAGDDGALFDVVVTNAAGSVTSAQATLHVTAPASIAILAQPAGTTVAAGAAATFQVGASCTGGTLGYQWQRSTDGGATFASIAGATAAAYTTPATTAADNGSEFRAVLSCGGTVVNSGAATLQVTAPAAVAITQQPAGAAVTAGATATFSVAASCTGGTLAYQWQKSTDGGATYANIAGATAASYTTPATATTDNGAMFRVVLSCAGTVVDSSGATLTVSAPPPPAAPTALLSVLPAGPFVDPAIVRGATCIAREPSGSYVFYDNAGLRRLSADLRTITTIVGLNVPIANTPSPFSNVLGVVADPAGTLYVADNGHNVIFKVVGTTVTALAGSLDVSGYADGTGAAAKFAGLMGIVLGPDGDLYVADQGNSLIRRVTTAGVVTTYAGTPGTFGYQDGPAATAMFGGPRSLAAAANGDLYVADAGNNRVRLVARAGASAGAVSTVAGDGTLNYLDGTGTAAEIAIPSRMAINGTTLYVMDRGGHIRTIDTGTRVVATLAGGYQSPTGDPVVDGDRTAATFDTSNGGIAVASDGSLVVADWSQLRTVSTSAAVHTLGYANGGGVNNALPPDGGMPDRAPFAWAVNTRGVSVAVDAAGNALVSDIYRAIRKVTPQGATSQYSGLPNGGCCSDGVGTYASYATIYSMLGAPDGSVYVGDGTALRKIDPAGSLSLYAGSTTQFGAVDGALGTGLLNQVRGIARDGAGILYVSDFYAIRKIDAAGTITTFSGALGQPAHVDGSATSARFQSPGPLAFGPDGALYVGDGSFIRRVAADGSVTTVASGATGYAGLVFDTDGTMYFLTSGGLYRQLQGSATTELLNPTSSSGLSNLAVSPQQLGVVFGMALLAPKRLVILDGNGEVLTAVLP